MRDQDSHVQPDAGVAPEIEKLLRGRGDRSLLAEAALRRGISVEILEDGNLRLIHRGETYLFRRSWANLNSRLARRCTRQKEITSRLLRQRGLPAPENTVFATSDEERAWMWAKPVLPVVVKPTAGRKGGHVHLGIEDRAAFARAFADVADGGEVLVERQVAGADHRFSIIGGEVFAVVQRIPPKVVGDGKRTVADLMEAKNEERRERANRIHKPIELDDAVVATLAEQGFGTGSVPGDGDEVFLRFVSNVSAGGEAVDRTGQITAEVVDVVLQAVRAIPGLRVAGLDVLLTDDDPPTPMIVEINSAPMLSMHRFPWSGESRDVYARILDHIFPSEAPDEVSAEAGHPRSG